MRKGRSEEEEKEQKRGRKMVKGERKGKKMRERRR